MLEALEFMHARNFVHRDLRDTSVFVESSGRVRVADFSIDKRVRELWTRSPSSSSSAPEDKFPVAIGRGGKKADVYRLGLLTLSLALGEIVQEPVTIPSKMFPPEFQDFLRRCLDKDERERWSSRDLLEHKWIKYKIERSPLRELNADGPSRVSNGKAGQILRDNRITGEEDDQDGNKGEEAAVPFLAVGSGQSRLGSEFSFISDLGKGGFGEVMKVKNNLDGQIYAIKRITLDAKNKAMTKKLMREVKLLSRLNHENVVRYYTSWIEVTIMEAVADGAEASSIDVEDDESSFGIRASPIKSPNEEKERKKSLVDDLLFQQAAHELLLCSTLKRPPKNKLGGSNNKGSVSKATPGNKKEEWSFSFQTPVNAEDSSEGSEEDDEEEDDLFGTSFLPTESWGGGGGSGVSGETSSSSSDDDDESDGRKRVTFNDVDEDDDSFVQFEASSRSLMTPESSMASAAGKSSSSLATSPPRSLPKVEIRRMYIQMEYCDKQTLRNAIDEGGLHKDAQRVWRMFREILEGLVHIHTQGMIHRDLKPVNIFIDSHDHIKIGDFGLATILGGKQQQAALDNVTIAESVDESNTNTTADDGLTGQIGTALYIAPEISQSSRTSYYTQKVDMYSLGVIFFEMCHNPLQTGMERIKVLTDLR